jgi:hypothetical protein
VTDGELVSAIQEEVVAWLADREGGTFHEVVSAVAERRGSPPHLPREEGPGTDAFYATWRATAEAVWTLIGSGSVVPMTVGTDARYENRTGISVPNQIRLSTLGREWLRTGELVIRNPDLYLRGLRPINLRITRCLREAVEAYARGLPLACVILLGAASEAAWNVVATAISERHGKVSQILDAPNAQARQAAVLTYFASRPKGKKIADLAGRHADYLALLGRFYADQRNYAAHSDELDVEIGLQLAATLLYQARDYFAAMTRLAEAI